MAERPASEPRPVTLADMNGRIAEIERQRDVAQRQCAVLAGERAEALDLLRQCEAERARLAAIVEAGALMPTDPAPGTAPN